MKDRKERRIENGERSMELGVRSFFCVIGKSAGRFYFALEFWRETFFHRLSPIHVHSNFTRAETIFSTVCVFFPTLCNSLSTECKNGLKRSKKFEVNACITRSMTYICNSSAARQDDLEGQRFWG